ncbi:MAG: hypothetical protein CVV25_05330 [Ignavibacteriae bacterium HGW-Ignavibacteriae-4]|jgi:hypothetical protein|nr:MAG: hypothetical protein CVV25_05330 [Ignavibacteriae bacterium HGW-Ignavibacteriae-4]
MRKLGLAVLVSLTICTLIYLSIKLDSDVLHALSSVFQIPSYLLLLLIGKNVHTMSLSQLLISSFIIYIVIVLIVVYLKRKFFTKYKKIK